MRLREFLEQYYPETSEAYCCGYVIPLRTAWDEFVLHIVRWLIPVTDPWGMVSEVFAVIRDLENRHEMQLVDILLDNMLDWNKMPSGDEYWYRLTISVSVDTEVDDNTSISDVVDASIFQTILNRGLYPC